MSTNKRWIAVWACVLAAAPIAWAGAGFADLSLKAALGKAEKQKKVVFVDFYTTWCMPCKMLDQTTFQDKKVTKWLAEKTVAIKIDAEAEEAIAEKYRIDSYPTLVFLKPNGEEIERLAGYVEADEFMTVAAGVEKGESVLDRAKRAAAAAPDNPFLQLEWAQALAMRGLNEQAFKKLIWCLDHGVEKDAAFAGVREGVVLMELMQLAEKYDPALTELGRRRDAVEKEILGGAPTSGDLTLFVEVNAMTDGSERTLTVFDKVKAASSKGKASSKETVERFIPLVLDALLEMHRYAEIAEHVNLSEKIAGIVREAEMGLGMNPEMRDMMRQGAAYDASRYYQVLVGLGKAEEARSAARAILKLDASAETYNMLAWAGYLTGKPLAQNLEQAKMAWELDEDKSVGVLDTLVRVMHERGQTAAAIAMCEQALKGISSERDKWILNSCIEEFRAAAAG